MKTNGHKRLRSLHLWLLASAALAGSSGIALAEGGCPDGTYPHNVPGLQGCAPIPGYGEQSQRRPVYESRWGAIAQDGPTGNTGTADGQPSKRAAKKLALDTCASSGSKDCKVVHHYRNGCAAVAWGSAQAQGVVSRAGLGWAEGAAMAECSKQAPDCKIIYSGCSDPVQVR